MKLLLDQNLSPLLVDRLKDVFPGSVHVRDAGLSAADDLAVWTYARDNGLVIVSKDSDFHDRGVLAGSPPKVVWIRKGNCSTGAVEQLLRSHVEQIKALISDSSARFLIVI